MEVRHPEASRYFTTIAPAHSNVVPEYRVRAYVDVLRVKLSGMLLVPTTIPSMEGAAIQVYDRTGAQYEPQWESQQAAPYPPAAPTGNVRGAPAPSNFPFIVGSPPVYYLRGKAQIGFVPPPGGIYTVQMDVVTMPPTLIAADQQSLYDETFLDVLAWRALQFCHASNSQDPQHEKRAATCQANWREALGRLYTWDRTTNTGQPNGPVVQTSRGVWAAPRVTYYPPGS